MSDLRLEDMQMLKPKRASTILLWGIAIFLVLFFIWASLTELDRTVRAQGRVVPSTQLQVLSNPESGVIEDILVKAGETVSAGQELIRLDSTASGAELGGGESSIGSLQLKVSRLQAEMAGRSPSFRIPNNPAQASQARTERALYQARISNRDSNLAAARARVVQAQRAVAEAQAAYQSKQEGQRQRERELEIIRPLVERGIEPQLTLMQAQSAASIARTDVAQAAQNVARLRAIISEAQAAVAQVNSNWRSQAATELSAAQAELDSRRQLQPALVDRVERTLITAPVTGLVNRVLVNTPGSSIAAGQALVEIVPSDDSLVVEARVRPEDIASVRIGMEARVALTAYDRTVFGTLPARVISLSPDSIVDESSGDVFYIVRVRTIENVLRDQSDRPLEISAGMVAEVDLLGEKRSVLEYLLTPITRLSETAFRE